MMGLFGFCFELWAIVILACWMSDRKNILMEHKTSVKQLETRQLGFL